MMRFVLVPTLLVLVSIASTSPSHAATPRPGASVKCCLDASVDDAPPHRFCFNLNVVRARARRARMRARIACRLIGGVPQRRRAA